MEKEMVTRAARLLGPRQIEVLAACANGDGLLGADYPKQRRQRMTLARKGLITLIVGYSGGYKITEFGQKVLDALGGK